MFQMKFVGRNNLQKQKKKKEKKISIRPKAIAIKHKK